MSKPLHVLILEDSEDDTLLLVRELRRGGYEPVYERVENAEAMKAALARQSWEVVLADYTMPHFSALAALALLKESQLDLPFIIVSGTVGEDVAVAAMKAGAHDYLSKGNLARLIPAIERELREAESRRQRWQAEQTLVDRERLFRALIEYAPDGITLLSAEGRLQYVSPSTSRILGYTPEEVVGRDPRELVHPEDQAYITDLLLNLIQKPGDIATAQYRFQHKDGSWRWLENTISNLLAEPSVQSIVFNFRDITERTEDEAELAQRAAQLALINDMGSQIAAMLDLDGVLNRAARLVQEAFGYHHVALFLIEGEVARLKAVAGSYQAYFPADHQQMLDQGIIGWVGRHGEKVVTNNVSQDPRYISKIADQTVTQAELCLPIKAAERIVGILDIQSPHLNAFGENDVIAMEALTHQIAVALENARLYQAAQKELAERKRAEAEIRQRNRELALFNEIIAASAAGLEPEAVLDIACRELALALELPQATAILFNEQKTEAVLVAEYLGTGSSEGKVSLLNTTRPVATNPILQHLLTHKTPLVVADAPTDPRLASFRTIIRPRGLVSFLMLPLLIEGQVVGGLGLETIEPRHFSLEEINLAWSVADQVAGALARVRLRQTHERLSTAIEQAAESVVITDTHGTIVYVNPAFERITGYSRAEAIGQNPRILKSDRQDRAVYEQLWTTISAGETWQGYLVNKKKDGTLYTEDATIAPVRNEGGDIVSYVAVKRDVTREVQLEEQYRQAQKMEAIGRLAGGVAHDFNNILVVITGYSELLLHRHFEEDDPARKYVEEIKKAGERAAGLTRQLLAFSRQQVLQTEILNLTELIPHTEKMLRRLIGEDIEIVARLASDLGQIKIDPGQIEQILMNLVINARDAMPHGGKLLIETANAELDETYTRHHPGVKPGRYVLLAVSDTGVGMDAATQAHIFEPFFTTKAPGKGTGLGLATVYGIVKQSGGDIWLYSEPGQGATFKIYLPRVDEPVPAVKEPRLVSDLSRGAETVLLVEDEASVRALARQILEMKGYTVLEASHGGEALLRVEQGAGPIDLVVTDVVMPGGLNGRELAERLKSLRPELKVLYISGYTDDAIIHHGVLEAGMHFLQKPFTPSALAQKVRQVLDTP